MLNNRDVRRPRQRILMILTAGLAMVPSLSCGGGGDTVAQTPLKTTASIKPTPHITHFYSDLDGTLLSKADEVVTENRAAVERFKAQGGLVGIATGRVPESGRRYADEIQANLPLIFANGAVITEPDGTLLRMSGIDNAEDIQAVCAEMAQSECEEIYTAYGNPKTGETSMKRKFCGPAETPGWMVIRMRARRCTHHKRLLTRLTERFAGGKYAAMESGTGEWLGITFGAHEANKDRALVFVMERLGLKAEQMAFIGDSGNDVSAAGWIHNAGGLCFAVANAVPALKAACPRHTTRDHEHGAVAEAIDSLMKRPSP